MDLNIKPGQSTAAKPALNPRLVTERSDVKRIYIELPVDLITGAGLISPVREENILDAAFGPSLARTKSKRDSRLKSENVA